ncbi:MAG: hypothetical protein ABIG67_02795 [Pseudomonadota bacterium]
MLYCEICPSYQRNRCYKPCVPVEELLKKVTKYQREITVPPDQLDYLFLSTAGSISNSIDPWPEEEEDYTELTDDPEEHLLQWVLDLLDPDEQRILRLYSEFLSYAEIGKLFQVSRQQIYKRIKKIRNKVDTFTKKEETPLSPSS